MSFEAKYHGRCSNDCGEQIAPGDRVQYRDDELVHVDCDTPPDPDVPGRNETRCRDCFTIHAEECL